MYVVTAGEMRRLDRLAIEGIGMPAMVLMENAGRAIADEALRLIEAKGRVGRAREQERWLVLVGKGNNGGDGLVAARHLLEAGVAVDAALAVAAEELTGEARQQAELAARFGVPCLDASQPGTALPWQRYSGVIDALLGTGAAGAPREPYAALIRAANDSGLPIVAADIPSGLDADTGAVHEPCIRAHSTVALAFLKRGLCQHPGAQAAGHVRAAPIGIPRQLARELGIAVRYITPATIQEALGLEDGAQGLPPRIPDSHKGTYGHVLAAAGSAAMLGAGLLAVSAALRAGSGLVTWALPASVAALAAGRIPEAMLAPLAELPSASQEQPSAASGGWPLVPPQALAEEASARSAVLIGPGLGRWTNDSQWLRSLWESLDRPLVLDADALNMLADAGNFRSWPRPRNRPVILTPHPGEMARLLRSSVREVQANRIGAAQSFAKNNQVILVLKGARTVTATPDGSVYINSTGNPNMATGGSGDVLAGIIVSLLAQGLPAHKAAALGVYLHGQAGDKAAAARPGHGSSLLAGDIVEQL